MSQQVRSVMSPNPLKLEATASLKEAARCMRDADIGALIVEKNGAICGIVTDRDLVVRGLAEGEADMKHVSEVCSDSIFTLSPDSDLDEAIQLMAEKAVRRIPVTENGSVVGILSLGDLALARDRHSALGSISGAAANR